MQIYQASPVPAASLVEFAERCSLPPAVTLARGGGAFTTVQSEEPLAQVGEAMDWTSCEGGFRLLPRCRGGVVSPTGPGGSAAASVAL